MAPVEPDPSAGAHATAEVEERQLLKAMSWWDGFMIALANPGFLVAALGGSIAGLGTTGALVLWLISVLLGSFQNNIYAELATFGYWFAWSTVLSTSGLICGTLIAAEFFPSVTFEASGGHFHLDLPVTI